MNYSFSSTIGNVTFDFENNKVVYDRNSFAIKNIGLSSMEVTFDEITDIELKAGGLLGSSQFNLILNGTRSVTGANIDVTEFFIKSKDLKACTEALRKVAEICGTGEFKKLNRKEVPKEKYVPKSAEPVEYRKKCNVCGKVFCYSTEDIKRNMELAKQAKRSAIMGGLNAVAGTRYDMYEQTKQAQGALDKIVDYKKCPSCNSTDISDLTEEEFRASIAANNSANTAASAVSSADELKKYKDILDSGIITQEEFDAKKKQLLGL